MNYKGEQMKEHIYRVEMMVEMYIEANNSNDAREIATQLIKGHELVTFAYPTDSKWVKKNNPCEKITVDN
jgi:hypothetical protein